MSGTMADAVAGWAPGPVETSDEIAPGPAAGLAGLFDQDPPAGTLPPLWHWLYFLDRSAQRDLGPDGHPLHGHFLPPIPGRRRMFAGARWTGPAPLRFGEVVTRRSSLVAVTPKSGRTGELLFTTVRHEFHQAGSLAGVEEQDIVYRRGAAPGPRPGPPPGAGPAAEPRLEPEPGPWRIDLTADPVLLFRFSALTYNAHRIHYDHAYATEVEGHPGLVVQGPLLALLLAELPRRAGRPVTALEFRAQAPLHAGRPCTLAGGPGTELRAVGPGGGTVMTMRATLGERPRADGV